MGRADTVENTSDGKYGLKNKDSSTEWTYFDVITVHGIHGDRETTWQARDESKRGTVKGLSDFKDDVQFRLMDYGYDAFKLLSKEAIAREAANLLHELAEARKSRDTDSFRTIAFLCHDIGGAIVKDALCQSINDSRYTDLADSTKWIIFFGYPHRCHDVLDMEEKIARLVFSGSRLPKGDVLLHVKNLAKAVVECNQAFVESKVILGKRIDNVISTSTDVREHIFNERESCFRTGFTCSRRLNQPHVFLPCAEELSELKPLLEGFMSWSTFEDYKLKVTSIRKSADPAEGSTYSSVLVSQASPVSPITWSRYQSHPLMSSQRYISWLNSRDSDVLVVHAQYSTKWLSGFASEEILDKLSLADVKTYFRFDQNDDRYSTTRAFLTTTLAQWMAIHRFVKAGFDLKTDMSRLHSQRTFTDDDLLALLFRLRFTYKKGKTVFVLENLDECADKLSSFWRLVAKVFQSLEWPWKFIIFTKSPDSLDEWLKSWPSITLEEVLFDFIDPHVRHDVDNTLSRLKDDNPAISTTRTYRDSLLECFGNDIDLARLLLQDLQSCHSQDILNSASEMLPDMTTKKLLKKAMDAIPEAKRSLLVKAITWVLFAFRPLSIGELQSALANSEQSRNLDLNEMMNALADSRIFDLSNAHEVRFQHAELRDVMLQSKDEWYFPTGNEHEMIVHTCLTFLGTSVAHEYLGAACVTEHGVLSTPSVKPRASLATYATVYWTRHYQLASNKLSLEPGVLSFLRCKASLRHWQMAHWFMSNPISRTDCTYLSELPFLASLGLQNIYECWKEDQSISEEQEQKWLPYAVAEAARNGHHEMSRGLLRSLVLDSKTAGHVLTAACSGGDEDLLIDFMSHIRTALPDFTWPAFLIRRASETGYVRVVQSLIDYGANLSGSGDAIFGASALELAVRNGQSEVVKLLVKHDRDLGHERKDLELLFATLYGHAELIRILIEHGARTETTQTLHKAVSVGAHRCVELLLKLGADPNGKSSGTTALVVAVEYNNIEMVKLLVKHGADVNLDATSRPPLYRACLNNNVEMVGLLIRLGARVDDVVDTTWTPLHSAYESAAITRLLLEAGASVNRVVEGSWCSPLLLAAFHSPAEVVEVLLEYKADMNLRYETDPSSTPLTAALGRGHSGIARLLLEAGADPSSKLENGMLPLWYADTPDLLRMVLEFAPDLAVRDEDGDTPLNAIVTRDTSTLDEVKLLVYAGSDVDAANDAGKTALHKAISRESLDIAQFLLKRGASVDVSGPLCGTPLHTACWGSVASVRLVMNAGFHVVNTAHAYLGTPAQAACRRSDPLSDDFESSGDMTLEILRCLSERSSGTAEAMDLDVAGGYYGCALSAACYRAPIAVVRYLLSLGASTRTRDQTGRCPIHWAAVGPDTASFEALCDEEADLYARDNMGRTIVHFAAVSGRMDLMRSVLQATEGLLHTADIDGWTPLHYAARGMYHQYAGMKNPEDEQVRKHEVVTFLIEQGADVWALSSEPNGKHWSPLKLAHCYGAKQETLNLLTPTTKINPEGKAWDDEFHKSKKAFYQKRFCDVCHARACGVWYECQDCPDFDLCYKCYAHKDVLHADPDHRWEPRGTGFDESHVEPEVAEEKPESSHNDNDDNHFDTDVSSEDDFYIV